VLCGRRVGDVGCHVGAGCDAINDSNRWEVLSYLSTTALQPGLKCVWRKAFSFSVCAVVCATHCFASLSL